MRGKGAEMVGKWLRFTGKWLRKYRGIFSFYFSIFKQIRMMNFEFGNGRLFGI